MPIDAVCPPSPALLAWLRRVRVRRLEFQHCSAAPLGDLSCLGFASSEQRYRAAISTLLATAEFVRSSAETLQVLSGVHPREGILLLTPFSALRRVAMCGNASEVCRMSILAGLPALREVVAAGYGEYVVEGLPASVERLNMQWAHIASSFATIHFVVPGGCSLRELALSAQRPVCLDASSLARCAVLRLSARRAYLGLPLRRGAPWADVDELAARWAQFMLASPLEAVEVTATRCFIFQPVQDVFDLGTNDGLGGVAQQDQLATVLLARHFRSLHVEQRMLAVGAFRAYVRISRRRTEPTAFSFHAPLNAEQLEFLQRQALATSIAFGPAAPPDALAVLNCPDFAQRNGGLLRHLSHLEVGSGLDLSPYSALQSIDGTWHGEPLAPLGAAGLTSLRLTPPLGAAPQLRAFRSGWLAGARGLCKLALARFATADLAQLRAAPSVVHLTSLQPPGGAISPDTLGLPPGGFGAGCQLSLRTALAPPHAAQQAAGGQQAGGAQGWLPPPPAAAAVALPQLAPAVMHQQAAMLAAMAQDAAAAAAAQLPPPPQAPAHAAAAAQQVAQQAALAGAVALEAHQAAAAAAAAAAAQQQGPAAGGPAVEGAAGEADQLPDLVSDDEEGEGDGGAAPPNQHQQQQGLAPLAWAPAPQLHAPQQQAGAGPAGVEAEAEEENVGEVEEEEEEDEDDDGPPGLIDVDSDEEGAAQGDLIAVPAPGLGGHWMVVPPAAIDAWVAAGGDPHQPGAGGGAGPLPAGGAFAAAQQAQGQQGQQLQAWAMPGDRLADATLQHDALLTAAGQLAVHAGALTVVYRGSGPADLLRTLSGGGTLRTLRLTARALRFEPAAAPPCGDAPAAPAGTPPPQQAGPRQQAQAAAADEAQEPPPQQQQQPGGSSQQRRRQGCTAAELRDFVAASEWAAVWEARLQRPQAGEQETLVLTRRQAPPGGQPPQRHLAVASTLRP